jgi:hypothetical protein
MPAESAGIFSDLSDSRAAQASSTATWGDLLTMAAQYGFEVK